MRIAVFDTETTGLDKPFCYDIGLVIYDTEKDIVLEKKQWIIEQVWYNLPLFHSAYYADKRQLYVSKLKGRIAKLTKFGYVMRSIASSLKFYNVTCAYAYNSRFDERVIAYNSNWYKVANPFDEIPIYDIKGNVHQSIALKEDFMEFLEEHELFTDTGNYSTTAENVYRYITGIVDFEEEHTGLEDALIELEILKRTVRLGLEYDIEYKNKSSIKREQERILTIVDRDKIEHIFEYSSMRMKKDRSRIDLK